MAVLIDASRLHPSTALALSALEWLEERITPQKILEIGCGNGILSLAAAQIWDARILACDISANAVADATQNARDYAPGTDITVLRSDGFKHSAIAAESPYGLIIGNLLAQWHVAMASEMAKNLEKGGTLLLAGVLAWQEDGMLSAFKSLNMKAIQHISNEGWQCYILQRTL